MNAIVIVLLPTQDGQPIPKQAGAVPGLDVWRVGRDNGNTDLRETSRHKGMTPPFWMWFIENPRTGGA